MDEAIKEIGEEGVNAAIVVADANEAYDFGLRLVKKHGIVVAIGL